MKTILFTQSVELTLDVEANVPDDWTPEDIEDFAKNFETVITVDVPQDFTELHDGVTINTIVVDNATIEYGEEVK